MKNLTERRELEKLRDLLVGPELAKLEQLTQRLETREVFSGDISEVLPEAMLKSAGQGEQLSKAMMPTVEEIVRLSVKRDINTFADALFPVIGPAIRKSIAETIRQMLQSMNQIIDNSFSVQGLKWRLESMRTGIPFSQIVLSHSLIFEVEQVFLIHQSTGLLLAHVEGENAASQSPDLVSSMLTAITDFVNDSFMPGKNYSLDCIEVGDISIWLEKSPTVILALAIRGTAAESMRGIMHETLEQIEAAYAKDLLNFKGNVGVFEPTQDTLRNCLQARYKSAEENQSSENNKSSVKGWIVTLLVAAALVFWFAYSWYQSHIQNNYLAIVENEPGYVVTGAEDIDGIFTIKGLRDPLARAPSQLIALSELAVDSVDHQFRPYQSLEDALILKRSINFLTPPPNVEASVDQGVLELRGFVDNDWVQTIDQKLMLSTGVTEINTDQLKDKIDLSALEFPESVSHQLDINTGLLQISGNATRSWRQRSQKISLEIPGVRSYDDSALVEIIDLAEFNAPKSVILELIDSKLKARGRASIQWIESFKSMVQDYAEIKDLELRGLISIEAEQLEADIRALQQKKIFFEQATSFNFEANQVLDEVIEIVQRIISNAKALTQEPEITIWGFSDSVGSFDDNKLLSFERADYVSQYIYNTGISPKYIVLKGLQAPVKPEANAAQRRFNRRVEFTVLLKYPGG